MCASGETGGRADRADLTIAVLANAVANTTCRVSQSRRGVPPAEPWPPHRDAAVERYFVFGVTVSPDGHELLFGAPTLGADIVLLEF